jgi:hypothetical protein
MFDTAFESIRKATESTMQVQQEMFKQLLGAWPGFPPSQPAVPEQVLKFQKKWAEVMTELIKKQSESFEAQFKVGLANIDEAFRLGKVKDTEELRAKTIELWQKTFDCMRRSSEAQTRDFQAAATRLAEVMMKGAAGCWAAS